MRYVPYNLCGSFKTAGPSIFDRVLCFTYTLVIGNYRYDNIVWINIEENLELNHTLPDVSDIYSSWLLATSYEFLGQDFEI